MPQALIDALERGELSEDQLRELISIEAGDLGFTFEEATERYRAGTLPKSAIGSDLKLLLRMLLD